MYKDIAFKLKYKTISVRQHLNISTFTFTFTTMPARPLYEAYVLGSVSVLTRCYCSVFNVHTPVLKALRLGAVTRKAGKAFHCSRVLGKKLYLRYVFLSRGTRNELECTFLECLLCGLSSLTISTSIRLFTIL